MAITKVTNSLVATNAIQGTLIADNAITSVHIAQNQVTSVQIPDSSITSTQLAANSVDTAELISGSIDAIHLASDSVTTAKILNANITTAKIANNAITSALIPDGSITDTQLGSGAFTMGTITTTGAIRGPASLTIDPATVGDNTGTVVIAGNLQVDGTTTTVNSTTLDVVDKNITLGKGGSASANNGGGITIDGADATILYTHSGTKWSFNKDIEVNKVLTNTVNNVGNSANIIYRSSTNTIVGNNASALVVQDGGNIGMGTTSPKVLSGQRSLTINATVPRIDFKVGDVFKHAVITEAEYISISADPDNNQANSRILFAVDNDTKMTLDSSGNLGLGVSPIAPLTINDNLASANTGGSIFVKNDDAQWTAGDPHIYNAAPDGILVTANSARTDGPDKMGLVLYNDNNTAGGFSPMLLFAKRETGSTAYRSAMAGIYAKAPLGTGNNDAWIDGQLHFATTGAATEGIKSRMVIDKEGKVIIGDTASHVDDLLQIETPASGGGHGIQIRRNDSNGDQGIGRIMFGNNNDTDLATIASITDGQADCARLVFSTQPTSGNSTERMRIDSKGSVGVGVTPNTGWNSNATGGRVPIQVGFGSISGRLNDLHTEFTNNAYASGTGNTPQWAGMTRWSKNQIALGSSGEISFNSTPTVTESAHNSNPNFDWVTKMKINVDGYTTFTSTRNEYAMELNSAGTRAGLVLNKPGTSTVMGSVLMLAAGESFNLGTASNYHVRMDQSGNTYMGNSSSTRFTQNGNLSVNTTTANSGITSGTDVRALGPCFANDANSFTMSQEGTGNTDAYLAARGANSSTRGNIHIGVSVSGGGNFKSGLIIDSTGRSTTPENPAFRARATAGEVLNSGWKKVGYNVLSESRGTGYSTTTSRFTAPIAGWYQFNAQWTANNNSDSDGTFSFWINGSATDLAASVSMPNTGGSYDGHSIAGCCYLASTHYVEVYRYSSVATTTRSSNPYGGWFSGFLIG